MNTELQNILDKYVLDQTNPDLNFKLAEAYYRLGAQAASCSYYLRAAEYSKDFLLKSECFIKMGYSYYKQGDRLKEVNLMAEYARANDPLDPRSYLLSCIVYAEEKDWINLMNISEMAIRLPLKLIELDELYLDPSAFYIYHAYSLIALGILSEAINDCNIVKSNARSEGVLTQADQLLKECNSLISNN